jgi:hypothetical protein
MVLKGQPGLSVVAWRYYQAYATGDFTGSFVFQQAVMGIIVTLVTLQALFIRRFPAQFFRIDLVTDSVTEALLMPCYRVTGTEVV